MSKLKQAAQAVIDRWETPAWKDVPATAVFIHALRAALAESEPTGERAELIASLRTHAIDFKRDNKIADMLEADGKLREAARLALKAMEKGYTDSGDEDYCIAVAALKEIL